MNEGFAYYGSREPEKNLVHELLLNNPPSVVAVDFECISLKNPEPVGLAIATSPTDSFYFQIQPEMSKLLPNALAILLNPKITKIFHNAIFDLSIFHEAFGLLLDESVIDTLVMAHLNNEREADLYSLGKLAGLEMPNFPKLRENIWEWSPEQIAIKACTDAEATLVLYHKYLNLIDADYLQMEMKIITILVVMASKGLKIDQLLRIQLDIELEEELLQYEAVADELGFNPGSPMQIAFMLAKDKVFLPPTRSRRSLRTDKSVLSKLGHPLAVFALAYRKAKKLHSTYIKPLEDEDRCFTHFHLDAITGRVSSSRHNMQNIPKGKYRNIFLPDSVCFTDLDFSQIELRTLAYLSQDPVMQAVFDSEGDIHQETADFLGISRYIAKSVNFAFLYGATLDTLLETAGIADKAKAMGLAILWHSLYPKASAWIKQQQTEALKAGYVRTLYGRKILLPSAFEESAEAIKRKAVNYPIQASAAEIVKKAMIKCAEAGLLDSMRLQVHDELLFDDDVEETLGQLGLDRISPFPTPYEVRILERWE